MNNFITKRHDVLKRFLKLVALAMAFQPLYSMAFFRSPNSEIINGSCNNQNNQWFMQHLHEFG